MATMYPLTVRLLGRRWPAMPVPSEQPSDKDLAALASELRQHTVALLRAAAAIRGDEDERS
jgi:hypothetical protein